MFEFYLKYGEKEGLEDHYQSSNPFYEHKSFKKFNYNFEDFHMIALSHQDEDKFVYQDDDVFIAIKGYVFFRYEFKELGLEALSPKRLLNLIKSETDFYKKIKGNFNIIYYKKTSGTLRVYNDHFALLPLYYSKINNALYLTNNLNHYKYIGLPVNPVVLLEQLVFDYPISNDTILRGVKCMKSGDFIEAKGEEQSVKNHSRLSELVFQEDLHRFDVHEFSDILNFGTSQKASLTDDRRVELDGGISSRVLVSSFLKKNLPFSAYSSGKAGGEETKIPYALSKEVGFEYHAVYQDEEYDKNLGQNIIQSLFHSDGQLGIDGAKHVFESSLLSKEVKYTYTADTIRELLLPIDFNNDLINKNYISVIYDKQEFNMNLLISNLGVLPIINQALIDNNQIPFFEKVQEKKIEIAGKGIGEEGFLFYIYDILKLIFKRTVGVKMHSQRFYLEQIPLFFDLDILQYLIRSQFNALYKEGLKEGIWKKAKPYQILAQILHMNENDLNKSACDQGFIPYNLLNVLKRPIVKSQLVKGGNPFVRKSDLKEAESFFEIVKGLELSSSKYFKVEAIQEYLENYKASTANKAINKSIESYLWINVL